MFKSEEIDLKHYWFVVVRQKKMILTAVCGCVLLATILNIVTPPIYRSTTRVEVNKEPTRSALTGEAIAGDDWRSDNVALFTAAELITSRALLRDVVAALYARGITRAGAGRRGAAQGDGVAVPDDLDQEIDWLLAVLTVKPIQQTRLVSIQVEHHDPKIAREIADTVAQKFVEYQKKTRSRADNERLEYLRLQAADVARDVQQMETELYNSRKAGVSVLDGQLKQLAETNGGLNDTYVKTRVERQTAGERLDRVRALLRDSTLNANEIPIQSETLEGLRHDLQQREAELARAREVYRDKHPKLIVLESELDAIRRSIRAELSKSIATLEEDYTNLKGREASLRSNIAQTDAQVRDLNDKLGQHATRENELKSKRDLLTLLTGKIQEAEISGQVEAPLAKVVEPATVGQEPVRPRRGLNLLLGLMVGLVSGVGLALTMEYLRRCIRTPKDVVEHLHLPVLGMIPRRA